RDCSRGGLAVGHSDSLSAGAGVSAAVGSLPGTCNGVVARAATRGDGIGIGDGRAGAGVGSGSIAGAGRRIVSGAAYGDVSRTGDRWSLGVGDSNSLSAGAGVSAAVGSLPGTCNGVVARAVTRGDGIGIGRGGAGGGGGSGR